MAIVSLISLTTFPASAGFESRDNIPDREILVNSDNRKINTFLSFVTTYIDWVKADPVNRYLSFVLTSNNNDQTVDYAEGTLDYVASTDNEYFSFPEGLSGEGSHLLNKRGWRADNVCSGAGFICEQEFGCGFDEENLFTPGNTDDVLISIFKNQKAILSINGSGVVFTPITVPPEFYTGLGSVTAPFIP